MKTYYYNSKKILNNKLKINNIIYLLKKGALIAFPTETVYGLGANIFNKKSIKKIYSIKNRPLDNPLILHIGDIEQLKILVDYISEKTLLLIKNFWPGPLTIILQKKKKLSLEYLGVRDTIGIRMPNHIFTKKLLSTGKLILAAPSANISGKPSSTTARHVLDDFNNKINIIIDGGKCSSGIESTIISLINDDIKILRPGSITKEMIEEVLKEKILFDSHLLNNNKIKNPIAPGMKYKHYSPSGKIYIFNNNDSCFKIYKIIKKEKISFKKTALIIFNKDYLKYRKIGISNYFYLGKENNLHETIYNFYSILRNCDKLDIELLFIKGIKEEGLGFSLMNRLKKAANYNYLN